jgi:hypothetical protein
LSQGLTADTTRATTLCAPQQGVAPAEKHARRTDSGKNVVGAVSRAFLHTSPARPPCAQHPSRNTHQHRNMHTGQTQMQNAVGTLSGGVLLTPPGRPPCAHPSRKVCAWIRLCCMCASAVAALVLASDLRNPSNQPGVTKTDDSTGHNTALHSSRQL